MIAAVPVEILVAIRRRWAPRGVPWAPDPTRIVWEPKDDASARGRGWVRAQAKQFWCREACPWRKVHTEHYWVWYAPPDPQLHGPFTAT